MPRLGTPSTGVVALELEARCAVEVHGLLATAGQVRLGAARDVHEDSKSRLGGLPSEYGPLARPGLVGGRRPALRHLPMR